MTVISRLALGCAIAVLAAVSAQAFTIENQGVAGNGAATRLDQDRKFNGSNNLGTYKQGNTTIQFGGRPGGSVNQQYNSDRLFDPATRLNSER